ncbi:MAG: Omp28-related outer membrane protein [Muribaculaceae bacterium]
MASVEKKLKQLLAVAVIAMSGMSAVGAEVDLGLSDILIEKVNYTVGETVSAVLSVENHGSEAVTAFVVDFSVNGVKVGEQTYEQTLLAGRSTKVDAEFSHGLTEQTFGAEIKATIATVNGVADDNADNNSVSETINVYKYLFDRNVVIEEGTGTWCGWCVRGIVEMEAAKEAHPYDFIGIAVHNNDRLTVAEYDSNMGITNFPACNLNREYTNMSISTGSFETFYQFGKLQGSVGDVYTTATVSDDNKVLSVTAEAEFCYTGTDTYNVAFVLVEDHVEGYKQHNYYSGGAEGEMGGFENMPDPVEIELNDVARGIYPEYAGATITTAQTIGVPVTYNLDITIPTSVQHKSNLSLVTLLIDASTGYIVNAFKSALGLSDDSGDTPGGGGDEPLPDAGDYHYVDLGLSVLWATANMDTADNGFGQVSAEELCGGYYGWGDPSGLLTAADDSLYPSGDLPTEISGTQYDIARAKWGGEWRLPTHEEFVELYNNCNTTTETLNGVAGTRFTSIKNGNSIFLPYNGSRYESDVWSVGEYGSYWSGTLYPEPMDGIYFAYELDFDDWGVNINNVAYRYEGFAIRPVHPLTGGVNDIDTTAQVTATTYYTLTGIEISQPMQGIYIKRETLSDGTSRVSKIAIR